MITRPPRATRMTHSFPTRRSSDLHLARMGALGAVEIGDHHLAGHHRLGHVDGAAADTAGADDDEPVVLADMLGLLQRAVGGDAGARSEEHTSELQSLMRISYAVFCLKKKTKYSETDLCD